MMNIRVNLQKSVDESYDVSIGELVPKHFKKACIVTNPTVSALHLEYLKTKITDRKSVV